LQSGELPTLEKANKLAHKFILCDGHIDFTWRLSGKGYTADERVRIAIKSNDGDFDYERAKKGGLSAPFMAIYISADLQEDLTKAQGEADFLINMLDSIIDAHPDKFARGRSMEEIESNFEEGLISMPMGLENGAPLITIEDVQRYYDKGIRYVTLTHAKDNHICDSSYDETNTWNGLSVYGKQLIAEMNRVGMIIDVSHVSDKAFYQVLERSVAPVLATHSSCRHYTPGWERNMDDDMIHLLARQDGVIMINFGSDFIDSRTTKKRAQRRKLIDKRLKKAGLEINDPESEAIIAEIAKESPDVFTDVSKVADHFDHVKRIAGIDHIGIGSDFDGVGDTLPTGLKDVSEYPNLIYELLKRGYTDEDIEKICYKNVWRVWRKVNETAASK
jgi:membrane dipeptidase